MDNASRDSATDTAARRPFQFTLCTLLAVVTLVALVVASALPIYNRAGQIFLFFLGLLVIVMGVCLRRRKLALFGALLVLLLFLVEVILARSSFVGRGTFLLRFRIVDAYTGQPVQGVLVRVISPACQPAVAEARSDDLGWGNVVTRLPVSGAKDLLRTRTSVIFGWRASLEITAKNYEPVRAPLEEYTGSSWYLPDGPIPPVTVRLCPIADVQKPAVNDSGSRESSRAEHCTVLVQRL